MYFDGESFGDFSEAWYHVRDMTLGDVVFCGGVFRNFGSPMLQEECRRVGELSLRSRMLEFLRDSVMRVPLTSTSVHVVWEYQAGLWALKSSIMMLLSRKLKRK